MRAVVSHTLPEDSDQRQDRTHDVHSKHAFPLDETNDDYYERNDEQQVYEAANMKYDKSQQPQDKQNNSDGPKHNRSF
jgi:hypothetical protein